MLQVGWHVAPFVRLLVQVPAAPLVGAGDVTLQSVAWQVLLEEVHFALVVQVAVPHIHGYAELLALPSVTEQSAAQVLLEDVHFLLVVHVEVPHAHGYAVLTALPSVVEQASAAQVLLADVHF